MREDVVRLSFDIPVDEHILLKSACAMARIPIKEFMHSMMLKGLKELKESELKKRLKKAIKESKERKVSSLGSFAKYVEDEI